MEGMGVGRGDLSSILAKRKRRCMPTPPDSGNTLDSRANTQREELCTEIQSLSVECLS